jgi:hypothetical protein
MATIQNAVQEMVDRFVTSMQGGTPLSPEDQLLFAKAVQAMQTNVSFEQAIIAVAEEHLDTSVTALTDAKDTFDLSVIEGVNALASAENSITSSSASLDVAATIPALLSTMGKHRDGMIGNVDDMLLADGESTLLSDSTYSGTVPCNNVIYCSDGEVRLHVSAQNAGSSNSGNYNLYHHFFSKEASSDPTTGTFTRHNYCYNSNTNTRSSWTHRYANIPAMTELPIASSTDAEDIQFKILIADGTSTAETAATYRGIGLFYDTDYNVGQGHYHTADVVDSYNRRAVRLTAGYHAQNSAVSVFYNNTKNCAVVIEEGKVWELYSDGWVDPVIPAFGTDAQAQTWMDEQPSMVLITMFQTTNAARAYTPLKYDSQANKSLINQMNSYDNANNVFTTMASPSVADYAPINAIEETSAQFRCSVTNPGPDGVDGAGNSSNYLAYSTSQQYLWEVADKKLVPTLREETLLVIPHNMFHSNSSASVYPWSQIKVRTKVTRLDTLEVIGEGQTSIMSKQGGTFMGARGGDILTYNPYNVNWMQSISFYNASIYDLEFRILTNLSKHNKNLVTRAE